MKKYPKAKSSDIDLKIMQRGIKYIADKHSVGFKKGFGHRKEWQDKKEFKTNRYEMIATICQYGQTTV